MPRWSRRRTLDTADLEKAAVKGGVSYSAEDVVTLMRAVVQAPGSNDLPRDPADNVAFGPGHPLFPAAIDPRRSDTGRPEPRITEYPVSFNLPGVTDRLVPWKVLRDFADRVPIARRCIEVRKAEIVGLDWDVVVSREAVNRAMKDDPTASKMDVEQTLRDRLEPQIARAVSFWRTPDRGNGLEFVDWVSQLLEEHFVLDALAIYPRRTLGGDLYSLEILDGSTIKVLLDHRGGRPLPPHPAYQQILNGFPRGEFTATTEQGTDGVVIPGGYPADQLIYRRRNVRTFTPYGYSATEQALVDGDLYLRRHGWMRAEYTDGVGGRLLETSQGPGAAEWTAAQLREYEDALNDLLSGNTAERRKFKLLPPGISSAHDAGDQSERYKPTFDLHLIKLLAGHYETTSTELGFAETSGLGGSGFHEGQEDVAARKGTKPTLAWLGSLITSIQRTHLGISPDLEFKWLGLDSEDEAAADLVTEQRFRSGRLTLNDARDSIGRPRYDFPEADMPMLATQRGIVFIEGASEAAAPGELVGPAMASPQQDLAADAEAGASNTKPAAGTAKPDATAKPVTKVDAAREGDDVPSDAGSDQTDADQATPVHLISGVGFDQSHAISHLDSALRVLDDLDDGPVKDALLFHLQHSSRHADGAKQHLDRYVKAVRRIDPAAAGEFDRLNELNSSLVKQEMTALRRFLTKTDRTRPFTAQHLTREQVQAAGLPTGRVRFLSEGGGGRGRPEGRASGLDGVPALRDDPWTGYPSPPRRAD